MSSSCPACHCIFRFSKNGTKVYVLWYKHLYGCLIPETGVKCKNILWYISRILRNLPSLRGVSSGEPENQKMAGWRCWRAANTRRGQKFRGRTHTRRLEKHRARYSRRCGHHFRACNLHFLLQTRPQTPPGGWWKALRGPSRWKKGDATSTRCLQLLHWHADSFTAAACLSARGYFTNLPQNSWLPGF